MQTYFIEVYMYVLRLLLFWNISAVIVYDKDIVKRQC